MASDTVKLAQLYDKGVPIYPASAAQAIEGVFPITKGGTGATNINDARENLGLNDIFLIRDFTPSESGTIGADNATVWVDFTVPTVSGYTPIALIGYYLGGAVGYACSIYNNYITNQVLHCAFQKDISTSGIVKFNSCRVLYIKTNLVV